MGPSSRYLGAVLTTVLVCWLAADPATIRGQGKKGKKEDARAMQARTDLNTLFRYWDEDKDNRLDAAELARGFRGAKAEPYQPSLTTAPGGTAEVTGSQGRGTSEPAKAPGNTPKLKLEVLKKKYPDYYFLLQWDEDRDDRVSFQEFKGFTDQVVAYAEDVFRHQEKIEDLQLELTKSAGKKAQRQRLEAQLRVVGNQLGVTRDGFRHQWHLDSLANAAGLRRMNWTWYKALQRK
jgi:hypothetical protein